MATLHYDDNPINRSIFSVWPDDIEGSRFDGWERKATYLVEVTVVIQINTTHVSPQEYQIAPNITKLSTNQLIVNIRRHWQRNNVSFTEFRNYYELREASLERYVTDLMNRLNTARASAGLSSRWYIETSLSERRITLKKPTRRKTG